MKHKSWTRVAGAILLEQDRRRAIALLADALLDATHARLAVRFSVVMSAGVPAVALALHARDHAPNDDVWRRESLNAEHPFTAYYTATGCRRPHSLDQVRAAGWELTAAGAQRLHRLGITAHQLALPLGGAAGAYTGWFFMSDDPYSDDEVERVAEVHDLVIGLDTHAHSIGATVGATDGVTASATASAKAAATAVGLTAGEQRILTMMHAGLTAPAMASRLDVSPRTVHKHQQNLYRKLGASDRLSAVLVAKRLGLLPGTDT